MASVAINQLRRLSSNIFQKQSGLSSIHHSTISKISSNATTEDVSQIWKVNKPETHVAHIELYRPHVKNAFSMETGNQLIKTLDNLDSDKTIRCIVLSGHGDDLTSGVDLKSFMGLYAQVQEIEESGRKSKLLLKIVESFQAPFKHLHQFSKPVICVMHGLCLGLAMEMAACSDIRYCTKDTRMAIREVLIGIAADVGSLQEMPRLVSNQSLLRELIYTGREILPTEAEKIGFVSKVCDSKDHALSAAIDTAAVIASRSPVAVQGSKRNLLFSRDKPFNVGLDYNAVWNMSMLQSEDVSRAIQGLLQREAKIDYEPY